MSGIDTPLAPDGSARYDSAPPATPDRTRVPAEPFGVQPVPRLRDLSAAQQRLVVALIEAGKGARTTERVEP